MGLHLYCVMPAGHVPTGETPGIDGAVVRAVRIGAVEVWFSTLEGRPRPDLERIQDHDRVIRTAMRGGATPLPFRFGQWFDEAEALERKVQTQMNPYLTALESVAGSAEFGVRLEASDERAADQGAAAQRAADPEMDQAKRVTSSPGAHYLATLAMRRGARAEQSRRGDAILAELEGCLGSCVRETRIDRPPRDGTLASAAHLVSRDRTREYREAVMSFANGQPGIEVRLTGPWAPYSFT